MNKELIKSDLQRVPRLLLGILILSFGIYLTKLAYIGLSPWSVLHDGIGIVLDVSFGNVTIFLGIIILVFSMIFLKTKVGIGTLLNILIAGNLINLFEMIYLETLDNLFTRIIIFAFGLLFTTFGRSLYISSNLGQGPRDGLFVGLARLTRFQVKHIKPAIEATVLLIGILLGGNFGVGTVVLVFTSGYLVQFFFRILSFDPKTKKQSDITNYKLKRKTT